jgi:GT2 family glycosyltransferase
MKNLRSRLSYRNWFYIIIKNYSLKDFIINLPEIIIQRLKNLSYFLRQSIQVYGWKVFYLFPLDFIKTSIEIIQNTPKMFNKRKSLQKLIESNHKI